MGSLGFHVRYLRDAGLVGPLVTFAAALAVVVHLGSETFESGSGRLGPFAWPRSMALWCALSAVALCLLRGWRLWYRGRTQADRAGSPPGGGTAPFAGTYHNGKMILGLAGLVLYGLGIAYMGFAFATCALLVYWLLISDVREPGTVIVIAPRRAGGSSLSVRQGRLYAIAPRERCIRYPDGGVVQSVGDLLRTCAAEIGICTHSARFSHRLAPAVFSPRRNDGDSPGSRGRPLARVPARELPAALSRDPRRGRGRGAAGDLVRERHGPQPAVHLCDVAGSGDAVPHRDLRRRNIRRLHLGGADQHPRLTGLAAPPPGTAIR